MCFSIERVLKGNYIIDDNHSKSLIISIQCFIDTSSYLPWVVAYLLESTLYNNKNNDNNCVTAFKVYLKGDYIISMIYDKKYK